MKISKYILSGVAFLALAPVFPSCNDDDLHETIFPDVPTTADPNSKTYKFDTWLNQNFRDPYNLTFIYKMEDVEIDKNYNLVPATYETAVDLALLVKYTWFDAYKEVAGVDLLKGNGPRMLMLVGSAAHDATQGTETLGLAEGGVKITLFKVNSMDLTDQLRLNEYYFRTMHHELSHILHQTRSYPTEFNLLSNGHYDGTNWQDRNGGLVLSLGFPTSYASSEFREDFAETIANYITRSPEQYEFMKWCAARGWYSGEDELDQSTAYCYYFYASEEDKAEDKKTYTLEFGDDRSGLLKVFDQYGFGYSTVAEVDQYLSELKEEYGEANVFPVEDVDKVDGVDIMTRKLKIAQDWLLDVWKVDLDRLRDEVQRRQKDFNIEELRKEIDNVVETPAQ